MIVDSNATTGPPCFKAASTSREVRNSIALLPGSFCSYSGGKSFMKRERREKEERRKMETGKIAM
jgi:hypothetical protein